MSRPWAKEEVDYLESHWGEKSITQIAKYLNRSINGIKCKAVRLELGRHIHSGDYITLHQLLIGLGLGSNYGYLTMRLKRDGFPIHYKKSINKGYAIVYIDEFWKWMKNNKQKLSFARFEKGALGKEPNWVDEKRRADLKNPARVNHNKPWSTKDDNKLIFMCKQNRYTYKDIAKELNRTEGAVKRRLHDLSVPYRPIPLDNHIKWTAEENQRMIELHEKGYDSNAIAIALNKTQLSICDRLKARGY